MHSPNFYHGGATALFGFGDFLNMGIQEEIMRIGILIGSEITYMDKPAFLIVWFGVWVLAIGRKTKEAE